MQTNLGLGFERCFLQTQVVNPGLGGHQVIHWYRHERGRPKRAEILESGTVYLANPDPTNSNGILQLASNTSSTAATIYVRFELCGQGARTNCVVDGDTNWYMGVKIQLANIDAPELHDYKCTSEKALGERSKRRLLELMNVGPFELVSSGSRDVDKYGRKLRDIQRNGRSLSLILLSEGLASPKVAQRHPYSGRAGFTLGGSTPRLVLTRHWPQQPFASSANL